MINKRIPFDLQGTECNLSIVRTSLRDSVVCRVRVAEKIGRVQVKQTMKEQKSLNLRHIPEASSQGRVR